MEATGGGGRLRRLVPIMESAEETAVPCSVRKRKTTEPDNQQEAEEQPEDQQEEEEDLPPPPGVMPACVIKGSKHADGSIYRQDTHFCHRLYLLHDIGETRLKPTNLSYLNTKECSPNWMNCRKHIGCAMMQIFSLKLANHHSATTAAGGPIELYGFMAARDLLEPLRNYFFNRGRDDPLVLHPSSEDPSAPLPIQMSSPKRGIYLQARALIEFDLRIKRATEDEDLQLIDGAATFSELTPFHGVYTQRIRGGGGNGAGAAVDISLALLRDAVEARVHVALPELPEDGLRRLSLSCRVSNLPHEIQIFDGAVDEPGVLVNGFVVAAMIGGPVYLLFKVEQQAGGGVIRGISGFPAKAHGGSQDSLSLGVATAEVKVFWANLIN